jgi:hypothetical protein
MAGASYRLSCSSPHLATPHLTIIFVIGLFRNSKVKKGNYSRASVPFIENYWFSAPGHPGDAGSVGQAGPGHGETQRGGARQEVRLRGRLLQR